MSPLPEKAARPTERPAERTAAERRSERRAERRLEERSRAAARLDTPRELRRRLVRRPNVDEDRFGVFAEKFARTMGTAKFLIWMTAFIVMWILWNTLAPEDLRFDHYAFIFLTLMLSLQASYAAPLILLAQNRQEMRDRVVAEQDRQTDAAAHADMEYLAREVASLRTAIGEVATRDYIRSELRALLADLDERARAAGAEPESDEGDVPRGGQETEPTSG